MGQGQPFRFIILIVLFYTVDIFPRNYKTLSNKITVSPKTSKKTFFTNFDSTAAGENPISEGGVWVNGNSAPTGLQNVQKKNWTYTNAQGQTITDGLAYSDDFVTGYTDPSAHLTGFSPNHGTEGVVHLRPGYTANGTHEIELHLRMSYGPGNQFHGYEINCWFAGGGLQIMRWDYPTLPNNNAFFTELSATGPGLGGLKDGDIVRAEINGNTIKVYKNNVLISTAVDPYPAITSGQPGIGFFVRPGAGSILQDYSWTSFKAWDL